MMYYDQNRLILIMPRNLQQATHLHLNYFSFHVLPGFL